MLKISLKWPRILRFADLVNVSLELDLLDQLLSFFKKSDKF